MSFFCRWTILVGKSTGFVCHHGQVVNGLVYHPVLSVMFWYFSQSQNWLVYQPVLSVVDKIVGISTVFVGRGQFGWYISVSCLDNIGW